MYGMKKTRVSRVEARRRPVAAVADRSRWDWYAESCRRAACLPATAARMPGLEGISGRPPAIGVSGHTWPGAGRARRGPAPAGFSTAWNPAS